MVTTGYVPLAPSKIQKPCLLVAFTFSDEFAGQLDGSPNFSRNIGLLARCRQGNGDNTINHAWYRNTSANGPPWL